MCLFGEPHLYCDSHVCVCVCLFVVYYIYNIRVCVSLDVLLFDAQSDAPSNHNPSGLGGQHMAKRPGRCPTTGGFWSQDPGWRLECRSLYENGSHGAARM